MRYKYLILSSICCLIIVFGCRRNPNDTLESTEINFSDYTKKSISEIGDIFYLDKRYVVLHANEQNLMLGAMSDVVLCNDKIFVADFRAKTLVVHDLNGCAIAKIGNRGRGPGEYITIECFDVDDLGRTHLIDGNTQRLLIYNSDYTFVEAKDLPFSVDIIKCMPDGEYLFGLSSLNKNRYEGTRIVRSTHDLKVTNETGTYDKKVTDDNVRFSPYHFIRTPDGIFYHKSVDETVYQLDENGTINKAYYFNLGRDAIPARYRNNLEPLINSGEIAAYRALMDFAVPYGEYIYGSMYDKGIPKSYIYGINNDIFYSIEGEDATNFGYLLTINNGYLITFFPYIHSNGLPEDLPEDMHKQVLDGDILICMYKLK